MKKASLLIIGKIPPPIGGVTIHVTRLLQWLKKLNYSHYFFLNLSKNGSLVIEFKNIIKHKTIHLHSSSPYLRFMVSLAGYILNKNIIITYHGNLLRFGKIRNSFDLLSIFLSKTPIVLNDSSYKIARKWNSNSIMLSAFIPPAQERELPETIKNKIVSLTKDYFVFCTNAFNVSFDKNGKEIYGMISLLNKFQCLEKSALIISDPSGNYQKYIHQQKIAYSSNVLFISEPHDFFEVLKLSDAFVRNTTTDGDSLSVKEALFLGKVVFATDAVSRPNGCIIYNNLDSVDLENELKQNMKLAKEQLDDDYVVDKLISIYKKYQ